ncbi:three-Cys-motif partner protein TcmP [Bradyrhizobium ontarionense]|uniref:Three-Cys-motif partner protein TcmP n=1 Tax=Bradyrhizobium ontarionense TaxID=2898149 RepID=A0ABY3R7P3_9BRAD|nr:three-Cys-motif partner protein TcmP [Bradyrhizobium sp. A19]UFZ03042.1 three-Cys-motif partner protein TcmP [Bradyrhizobium sp. A19]
MKQSDKIDPADGLVVSEVGEWAEEKHARVRRYIELASVARKDYLPPPVWRAGASYIELFSGPGRSLVRDTDRIIDGSPLVACKAAQANKTPFTEMHLNDMESANSAAVGQRLKAIGGNPICYSRPAIAAVDDIIASLNPGGLHFAFLDPFNLEALSFDLVRKLSQLKRVDMLIHVSVQDLQRNSDKYSAPGSNVLETFAPGWRKVVDPSQANRPFRAALMAYWMQEIEKLGKAPARGVELVRGSKDQPLYWLVFVSGHQLAQKFWEAIRRDPREQREMDF